MLKVIGLCVSVWMLCAGITGCGLKGDLYLPQNAPAKKEVPFGRRELSLPMPADAQDTDERDKKARDQTTTSY